MLKERFRFRDILGVICAVFGATVVVLSSKSEEIKASHNITSDLAMSTSTCKLILSYLVIQLSPDLVVEYLTSMEAIIYYSVTGGLILLLTALSPRWGSTSILIDLGLVALYGKNLLPFSRSHATFTWPSLRYLNNWKSNRSIHRPFHQKRIFAPQPNILQNVHVSALGFPKLSLSRAGEDDCCRHDHDIICLHLQISCIICSISCVGVDCYYSNQISQQSSSEVWCDGGNTDPICTIHCIGNHW